MLNSDFLEFENSSLIKLLAIRWYAKSDKLYFSPTPLDSKSKFTKREVLSQIAKLFDPAGWLEPCIVIAKMLMQQIWLEKLSKMGHFSEGFSKYGFSSVQIATSNFIFSVTLSNRPLPLPCTFAVESQTVFKSQKLKSNAVRMCFA